LRVLVVDADCGAADSLAQALVLMGWSARVAHNRQEAIDIARAWLPQVALLDLVMPHCDGLQLARLLRGLPGLARLQLVTLTGVTGTEYEAQAEAAGFRACLLKPVKFPALDHLLDDLAKRISAVTSRETMPGAERFSVAGDAQCPGFALLEQLAREGDWLLRGRYVARMSRALAARTRGELLVTRSIIAQGQSLVQEGRRRSTAWRKTKPRVKGSCAAREFASY
jgi:CheY-like chemotaxis protein